MFCRHFKPRGPKVGTEYNPLLAIGRKSKTCSDIRYATVWLKTIYYTSILTLGLLMSFDESLRLTSVHGSAQASHQTREGLGSSPWAYLASRQVSNNSTAYIRTKLRLSSHQSIIITSVVEQSPNDMR